jgi:hypothetical protein
MRKLKEVHKGLMIFEAGFVYCKRHNLDYEIFIDDIFMSEEFDCSDGSEFDNICKDLRCFRHYGSYNLCEISLEEYEMCLDKFGSA